MHFMSTLYFFGTHMTYFENTVLFQLLFSAQLLWSPLLMNVVCVYCRG